MTVAGGEDEMRGERIVVVGGGGEDVDLAEERVWGPLEGGDEGGERRGGERR